MDGKLMQEKMGILNKYSSKFKVIVCNTTFEPNKWREMWATDEKVRRVTKDDCTLVESNNKFGVHLDGLSETNVHFHQTFFKSSRNGQWILVKHRTLNKVEKRGLVGLEILE